jgi:S1-C subfamily serine protease
VAIRDDGLVLTIGYLINEASQIWLTSNRGTVVEGHRVGYDQATGFGLIQPLGKLDVPHLPRGLASDVKVGDSAFVLGHGGVGHALKTQVIDKREFAGSWEYVLDEALLVQQEVSGEGAHVNMFVPIDLLDPILDAMLQTGRSPHPPHPWLGMSTQDPEDKLVVSKLTPGGPAERAGVQVGDMVLGVGELRVKGLAEFFRTVWRLGAVGVEVPLTLARDGDVLRITVKSADRSDFLKKPNLH